MCARRAELTGLYIIMYPIIYAMDGFFSRVSCSRRLALVFLARRPLLLVRLLAELWAYCGFGFAGMGCV